MSQGLPAAGSVLHRSVGAPGDQPQPQPQEYKCLEQENAVLRRELRKLTEELRHLSDALKEHEKMRPLLLCP